MSDQQVFNMLSELEEFFYYKMCNPEELGAHWSSLVEMHQEVKTLLCQWHNLTGCKNES